MGAPLARSLVRLPSPSLTLLFSPTVALTKFKLQASFVRCSRQPRCHARASAGDPDFGVSEGDRSTDLRTSGPPPAPKDTVTVNEHSTRKG